jgi:cytochrome P450
MHHIQTVSTIRGFFLAMALNPDVLRKAQEEINTIVGSQRLPSIVDKTRLPYINALILELFRWIIVAPNG